MSASPSPLEEGACRVRSAEVCRLAVDIGGTFTDIVLESGQMRRTRKVLTTPEAPERAVMEGIGACLGEAGLALGDVAVIVHGTTLATNAIIERKGPVTALVATQGFRDVLEIAYESRYDQYDIFIEKAVPLVPRRLRFTVPERVDVEGRVRVPLDEAAVAALVPRLKEAGVGAVAVSLIHAYANPDHEARIGAMLRAALPGVAVSLSSEVCPEVREYERTSTTVANAYVQPLMAGYLRRLEAALGAAGFAGTVYLMTSGGGLTTLDTAARYPVRLIESGPAGGAILAAWVAAAAGERKVVSFDMGGTTAKICLIEAFTPQTSRAFEVDRAARFLRGSGLPLRIPVIEMVEIGAGGGSIAQVDAMRRIAVGPESAGSVPGPACYGGGGSAPTVTDADAVLGRIDPLHFAGGRIPLHRDLAAAALDRTIGRPLDLPTELAAYGVTEIVDETMANAARVHAVERGAAIGDHALIAFGGAAPLHAARLAEKLGIARIIVPPQAGVGSAVGFLRAPIAYEVVRSRPMRLACFDAAAANAVLRPMAAEAHAVVAAGAARAAVGEKRQAFMRYVGQGHEIVVPVPARDLAQADAALLRTAFEGAYRALFGRIIPDGAIEVLSWAVSVATAAAAPAPPPGIAAPHDARPAGTRPIYDPERGGSIAIPLYWRPDLAPGARLAGPALIAEDETSTFVTARFTAHIDAGHNIVLDRKTGASP